jgi:hypothetical protein
MKNAPAEMPPKDVGKIHNGMNAPGLSVVILTRNLATNLRLRKCKFYTT